MYIDWCIVYTPEFYYYYFLHKKNKIIFVYLFNNFFIFCKLKNVFMENKEKYQEPKLYKLNILNSWIPDDKNWVEEFIQLLISEIEIKIDSIFFAINENDTAKLVFSVHQLAMQLAFIENEEINHLISRIDVNVEKYTKIEDIEILVAKIYEVIRKLKSDFNLM